MSYYVEFAKFMLKSELGYTPILLMGDSSIRTGHGGIAGKKWCTYGTLLGASAHEVETVFASSCHGNEHWKTTHGTWVDDKALMSWAKRAPKAAVMLEDIIAYNPIYAMRCTVRLADSYEKVPELTRDVKTTREFDNWILEYRSRIFENEDITLSFSLDFGNPEQNFALPPHLDPNSRYYIKIGKNYVSAVKGLVLNSWGKWKLSGYTCGPREPAEGPYNSESAWRVMLALRGFWNFLKHPVAVKAETVDTRMEDYVLQCVSDAYHGRYLADSGSAAHVKLTPILGWARRYSSLASAKSAAKTINRKNYAPPVKVEVIGIPRQEPPKPIVRDILPAL